jgi:hypothetical protein
MNEKDTDSEFDLCEFFGFEPTDDESEKTEKTLDASA